MNQLKAGFFRINATPPLGIEIAGYYNVRYADAILDDLKSQPLLWKQAGIRWF